MTDLTNSIKAILYERLSGPFLGTFTFAWIAWNWRIFYLTLYVDAESLGVNKLKFIFDHYYEADYLIWRPLLSTVILITVVPFISNGAFWAQIRFKHWRIKQRNQFEAIQPLTQEQSNRLRKQLRDVRKDYDESIEEKDAEIDSLKAEIEGLKKELEDFQFATSNSNKPEGSSSTVNPPSNDGPSTGPSSESDDSRLLRMLKRNPSLYVEFGRETQTVRESGQLSKKISKDLYDFLTINDLVKINGNSSNHYLMTFTEEGKKLQREHFNDRMDRKGNEPAQG